MVETIGNSRLYLGDAVAVLKNLPSNSVDCCVTSPPYFGLRDYGHEEQIGAERKLSEYVAKLIAVFAEVRRVLRDEGTLWLNLGDSYAGSWGTQSRKHAGKHAYNDSQLSANQIRAEQRKQTGTGTIDPDSGVKRKEIYGVPWRVAFALQSDGWYLRQDIIWSKPNPMPESVRDRCTKSHEYIFMLTKSERYYFDAKAISEPATYAGQMRGGSTNRYEQNSAGMDCKIYDRRNKRSVWTVKPAKFKSAHFATFPPALIEPMVLAGCPHGGTVLDPFAGAGTVGVVCQQHNRNHVGIELNRDYLQIARDRIQAVAKGTDA